MPNDTLDFFLARPVVVNENHLNSDNSSTYFGGIYNVTELPAVLPGANSKLDLYVLSLDRSVPSTNTADSTTYTVGTRFHTNPGPWDFDAEPDFQFGKYASRQINAYAIATEAGYTFLNVPLTPGPRLALTWPAVRGIRPAGSISCFRRSTFTSGTCISLAAKTWSICIPV